MFSAKVVATTFGILFVIMAYNATAQWSPGGTMVYRGDLNLAASSASSEGALNSDDSPKIIQQPLGNSSMNNSSMNNSTFNNSMKFGTSNLTSGSKPLDLSGYARDRANDNLTGYKNIMYPISGSRGTTTSTSGSGGCGCG
jgi:hypothetical protein